MKSKKFDIEEVINMDSKSPRRIAYGIGTFIVSVAAFVVFSIYFMSNFLQDLESFRNLMLIASISISIILAAWFAFLVMNSIPTRKPLRIQISSEYVRLFIPEQEVIEISNRGLTEINWWSPSLQFLDSEKLYWKIPAHYADVGYAKTSLSRQVGESFLSGFMELLIQNGKLQVVRIPQRSFPVLTRFFNHPLSRF